MNTQTDRNFARAMCILGALITGFGIGFIEHRPVLATWSILIGFLITVFFAKLNFSEGT